MPVVPCMVASPTLPIGSWIWIWGPNTHTLRHCRVTDTSEDRDRARHIRMRRVELGHSEAISLCGRAAMRDRPEQCKIIVFRVNE